MLKSTTTPPSTATATRSLVRLTLLVAIVLAVPLVGFAAWAGSLEEWLALWRENPPSPLLVGGHSCAAVGERYTAAHSLRPPHYLGGCPTGGRLCGCGRLAWADAGRSRRFWDSPSVTVARLPRGLASPEDIEALRHNREAARCLAAAYHPTSACGGRGNSASPRVASDELAPACWEVWGSETEWSQSSLPC